MEISTDLLVKIVVLLTAIVGLYKTASFKMAEPFLVQLFAALSFLVLPAMLLVFLWLSNATMNMMNTRKSTATYTGADAEVMYEISRDLWNQQTRQEALKLVIDRAFETKQWAVVVKASGDLNPTSQRDDVLMRAMKVLGGELDMTGLKPLKEEGK